MRARYFRVSPPDAPSFFTHPCQPTMASLQYIQTTAAPKRSSKRKRVTVNYREEDLSDEDIDFDGDTASAPTFKSKKRKTSAPKPRPKRNIFPFLSLPGEIRNQIYKLCFTDPAGIYLSTTTIAFRRTVRRCPEATYRKSATVNADEVEEGDGGEEQKRPSEHFQPLVPALLATNRQIYHEGRDILYGNDFYLATPTAMHSFLVDIGARAASLLKSVLLIYWAEGRGVHKAYNHAAFAALASATNLERFVMHGHTSYREHPKHVATQFYRDAFPWLEAVGITKGKADAAVNLINISADSFINISKRRWWRGAMRCEGGYDQIDSFRKELAKLLNARMDKIRS